MTSTIDIGRQAEQAAVDYLRGNNFMILERNWRSGRYEIDIIAQRWDTIHFVEVKSRTLGGWSSPEDAIDSSKISSMQRGARAYLALKRSKMQYQFDLIAVETLCGEIEELRYIERVFEDRW
ncbi:MAG: YraN family protein [Rikenellaceae bacterium]